MIERTKVLKSLKSFATSILNENLELHDNAKGWVKDRTERNIFNLKNIISDLNKDLEMGNRESYKECIDALSKEKKLNSNSGKVSGEAIFNFQKLMSYTIPFLTETKIALNSIKVSIDLDLNNAMHLNTRNIVDMSCNLKQPNFLIESIPDMINRLKEKLIIIKSYMPEANVLHELSLTTLKLSEERTFTGSNIVLMSLIEGYALRFLKSVLLFQNQDKKEEEVDHIIYHEYGSLNKLISKIALKPDFPITYSDCQTKYGDSNNRVIIEAEKRFRLNIQARKDILQSITSLKNIMENKSLSKKEQLDKVGKKLKGIRLLEEHEKIEDLNEEILVPVTVNLNFLQRRMYEDRNLILHGQFDKIENTWKNYLYLNGLFKLFETIEEYELKVKNA